MNSIENASATTSNSPTIVSPKDGEIIFAVNLSGNTGKTTLTKHLQSVMPEGTQLISVDGVNSLDATVDKEVSGAKFQALAAHIGAAELSDSFLVDIGASQIAVVLEHMAKLRSLTQSVTGFLVPCTPIDKQIADTIKTIDILIAMKVKKSRISVVLNMVNRLEDVPQDFSLLIAHCEEVGVEILPSAVAASDAFTYLRGQDRTVFDVEAMADEMDWRAERRKASGDTERMKEIAHEVLIEDLSLVAAENLREVFSTTLLAGK